MTTTNVLKSLGASDIDTKELMTSLVNAVKEPRQKLIDNEKKRADVAISSIALLKSALATFQSAATEVGSVGKLNKVSVTSSDSSVVSAQKFGVGVARDGSYTVIVDKLATPDRKLVNLTSGQLPLAADETVTVTRGSTTASIGLKKDDTASDIVAKINSNSAIQGLKIKASVIETGDSVNPYAFVLESQTGTINRFSTSTSTGGVLNFSVLGDRAANAELTVNGVAITRASNTVTDAVAGLSLQLTKADPAKEKQITVATDSAGLIENIQNFVDSYNLIREFLVKATGPEVEGDDVAGSLRSDVNARGVLNRIRSILIDESSSKSGKITHWSSLGVSLDRNGALQLDKDKFTEAFNGNPAAAIEALSSNASTPRIYSDSTVPSGLAGDLARAAYQMGKTTGLVDLMQKGFESRLTTVDKKQATLDRYIEKITAQYERQFTSLNAALSAFKNTQSQLERSLNLKTDN